MDDRKSERSASKPDSLPGRRARAGCSSDRPADGNRRQSEASTLDLTGQWEQVFDALPDLIAILDTEYRVVWVNRAMADRLGLAREECIGQMCYECLHGMDEPPSFCPHRQLLQHGESRPIEVREARFGGDFLVSAAPLRDTTGRLIGSVYRAHDITERKRTERLQGRSEARLKAIFRTTPAGIGLVSGRLLREVNDRLCKMVGYTRAELLNQPASILYPSDTDAERVWREEWATIHRRDAGNVQTKWRRKDGTIIAVVLSSTPLDLDDLADGLTFTALDVTQQLQAQDLLQVQHDLSLALAGARSLDDAARLCLDAAIRVSQTDAGGLYLVDRETGDLDLSCSRGLSAEFLATATHYDADSPNGLLVAKGLPVYKAYEDIDVPLNAAHRAERIRAVAVVPVLFEGRAVACLNVGSHSMDEIPASGRMAVEGIAMWIGGAIARLQAEKALRESENRYRSLLQKIRTAVMVLGPDLRITASNARAQEWLRLREGEVAGEAADNRHWEVLRADGEPMPPEDWPIRVAVSTRQPVTDVTVGLRRPGEAEILWGLVHADPVLDERGNVLQVVATFADVTEHKRVENDLRESRELLRATVESTADGLLVLDDQGRVTYSNTRMFQMWGIPTELVARGTDVRRFALVAEQLIDQEGFLAGIESLCRSADEDFGTLKFTDGRVFEQHSCPLLRDRRTAGRVWSFRDVTERTRVVERLRQSELRQAEAEKVAATGRMAARVAHEINNPLAGIKNAFRLVKDAVPSDHPDHDMVGRIEREIDRIAAIVRQMYTVYSPRTQTPSDVAVEETARDVLVMLDSLQREKGVRIELSPVSPKLSVCAPPGKIQQILYNLTANAIEASPRDGTVNIEAAQVDKNYVRVTVRDQGVGIPLEDRRRVFEPFYSADIGGVSKEGLGLGLSIVKDIVESFQGKIELESGASGGTSFHVYLPSSQSGTRGC